MHIYIYIYINIYIYICIYFFALFSLQSKASTCSKLAIETIEKGVKYVQS